MSKKQSATLTNHLSEESLRAMVHEVMERLGPDDSYIIKSYIERVENTVAAGYASIKAYQAALKREWGLKE